MNSILMKHRPAGTSKEEWEKTWQNSRHILDPLAATLIEMKRGKGAISKDDFDTPNHYAKLVAELVETQTLDKILEMLPK